MLGPNTMSSVNVHRTLPLPGNAFFAVHMAIVTTSIGKEIMVNDGCCLEYVIRQLFNHQEVQIQPRTDEENSSVQLRVLDWAAVEKRYGELLPEKRVTLPQCTASGIVSVTAKVCKNLCLGIRDFQWR